MIQLAGWDGPACIGEGVYRYSKIRGWSRLYIDINGSEFKGGLTGSSENFEVVLEEGEWKRYDTNLVCAPSGDIVLKLIDCTTLDIVFERVGKGTKIQEDIETIEDLVAYLEKSVFSSVIRAIFGILIHLCYDSSVIPRVAESKRLTA